MSWRSLQATEEDFLASCSVEPPLKSPLQDDILSGLFLLHSQSNDLFFLLQLYNQLCCLLLVTNSQSNNLSSCQLFCSEKQVTWLAVSKKRPEIMLSCKGDFKGSCAGEGGNLIIFCSPDTKDASCARQQLLLWGQISHQLDSVLLKFLLSDKIPY